MQSKYETVKKIIINEIRTGEWAEGDKIPPQRTLETTHDVSRITIKKAIADLIIEGVLEHQDGKKGIFVSSKKSGNGKTQTIAVSLDDITNHYDSNLLKGIEDSLWKQNYHTIVCNANRNMDKVESYFNSFDFTKVDGIIHLPVVTPEYVERNKKIIRLFQEKKKPFVLIDQYIPGIAANSVSTDHRNGSGELCKALIENGHKKILIGTGVSCYAVQERISGIRDAMSQSGLPLDENKILEINDNLLTPGAEPNPDEMHKIEEMIKTAGEFTAFYAVNNRIMKAVVITLVKLGYDMSKIQLALHNEVNKPVPPFTDNIPHIIPHLYQIGFEAANLLLKVLETGNEHTLQMTIKSSVNLGGLKKGN